MSFVVVVVVVVFEDAQSQTIHCSIIQLLVTIELNNLEGRCYGLV